MVLAVVMASAGCGGRKSDGSASTENNGSDSTVAAVVMPTLEELTLPDTSFQSAEHIVYRVECQDSDVHELKYYDDLYQQSPNVMTFRRNLMRNADFGGRVTGTPADIEIAWTFETAFDTTHTKFGQWGGGTGWTGQPLYMHWTDEEMSLLRQQVPTLTADFAEEEIMVGSLCGKAYFINFQTGLASRQPLDLHNVVKGTMSKDPELMNLYVGQGVPKGEPLGCQAFSLLTHQRMTFFNDTRAWRGWQAFDSSPIVAGGYLFWPGENGSLFKFERTAEGLQLVSALRYRVRGAAPGIESSLCVYRNYGFFSDNHGNVVCVNLNTMRPVWHYDNHDDSDGTMVCRVENDTPYLYTGCEVDKQGAQGICHIIKLNGLTGEPVWDTPIACHRVELPTKTLDGGMYASPLLGTGDCHDMLFANICRNGASDSRGELTAFSTETGEVLWTVPYGVFAWSSPVSFLNEQDEMFVFTGDANGYVYLVRGRTGEVLVKKAVGFNFESSPCVVGNSAVVGTRGRNIYKFVMK